MSKTYLVLLFGIPAAVCLGFFTRFQSDTPGETAASDTERVLTFTLDFGVVEAESSLVHSFEIRNDTDFEWKRTAIRKSCGCTTVGVPMRLDQRAACRAEVTLQTPKHSELLSRSLAIDFIDNQGKLVKVVCELRADVRSRIDIEPKSVEFGNLSPRSAARSSQIISIRSPHLEQIRDVIVPSWVTLTRLPIVDTDRHAYRLQPNVVTMQHGRNTGYLTVRMQPDLSREYSVFVTAQLLGLDVEPKILFFGNVRGTNLLEKRILVHLDEIHAGKLTVSHDLGDGVELRSGTVRDQSKEFICQVDPTRIKVNSAVCKGTLLFMWTEDTGQQLSQTVPFVLKLIE